MRIIFFFLGLQFFTSVLFALQEAPKPVITDPRFRTYIYHPYEVYSFTGHFMYQSIIEFDPEENIASVSMGDPTGWQIVPNANRLFLKPLDDLTVTNMTVITDKRIYHFEMYAKEAEDIRDEQMVFVLRFIYPENSLSTVQNYAASGIPDLSEPEKYNFNYTITGPEYIAPLKIFDDNEFTYFQFRDINADLPAFFSVDVTGQESLVNFRVVKDYIVVERVTSQFTLRYGPDVICVYNENKPLQRVINVKKEKKFLGVFSS